MGHSMNTPSNRTQEKPWVFRETPTPNYILVAFYILCLDSAVSLIGRLT